MFKQAEPSGLDDIRRVAVDQLEIGGNGPDEPGELVNQAFPGLPVARGGTPHESGDVGCTGTALARFHHSISPIVRRAAQAPVASSVAAEAVRRYGIKLVSVTAMPDRAMAASSGTCLISARPPHQN